jgi:hypothetical protein
LTAGPASGKICMTVGAAEAEVELERKAGSAPVKSKRMGLDLRAGRFVARADEGRSVEMARSAARQLVASSGRAVASVGFGIELRLPAAAVVAERLRAALPKRKRPALHLTRRH